MKDMSSVHWRKSSHSDHSGGNCIEAANLAPMVGVRDSKDPDGPRLAFSPAVWGAFTAAIKSGVHDLS